MRSEVPTEVIYPLDRHFRNKEGLITTDEDGRHEDGKHEDGKHEDGKHEDDNPPTPGSLRLNDEPFDRNSHLAVFGHQGRYEADQMLIDEETSFRWGYGAHEAWGRAATHLGPNNKSVARFKLILDNSPRTEW
ncbi:hypothetical protein QBC43DRAFT_285955 [Cladorrhinum sp. PSN259]|nr:hypothetical protein QBC43DRAFT_285955 [Cladorrhinum sp. PSN259]